MPLLNHSANAPSDMEGKKEGFLYIGDKHDIAWKPKCFLNWIQIFRLCKTKGLEEKQEGLIDNEEHNKACKETLLQESPSISTHAGTH